MNQKVKVLPAPMVHRTASISVSSSPRPHAGVISRGLRGSPLVKITVQFEGLSPPKSSCIELASKVLCFVMINHSLLYGKGDISNC